MILMDTDIRSAMRAGHIDLRPFKEEALGSNSYDLHLGRQLMVYNDIELDCKREPSTLSLNIPETGYVLKPGELYLGTTLEYTNSRKYVPLIEGKSSIGRLGISVHITAGFGDYGFEGHWTLEITAQKPVRVYAGIPIAQIYFIVPLGICSQPYSKKPSAKYRNQPGVPVASQMFRNFETLTNNS